MSLAPVASLKNGCHDMDEKATQQIKASPRRAEISTEQQIYAGINQQGSNQPLEQRARAALERFTSEMHPINWLRRTKVNDMVLV